MLGGTNQMLRVAFVLNLSKNWLGGVNYYKNLLISVTNYSKTITPVLFVPSDMDMSCLNGFPSVEIHKTCLLKRWHPLWVLSHVSMTIFRIDWLLTALFHYYKISIISHDGFGIKYPGVKSFSWIPDFQHRYLSDFFSRRELRRRDCAYNGMASNSDKVILSSYAAKADFDSFYPKYASKSVVLQFVPDLNLEINSDSDYVLEKYNLPKKFFFLPNQYWIHKNHKIVLCALKSLKDSGVRDIVVVSTGNTNDYRARGYFDEIKEYIHQNDLSHNYRVLGLIPYQDVQALACLSIAYINPSLFEGWSTVVEEAKYRGKRIILSNLKVHIEQAPEKGYYFSPQNVDELAGIMQQVWNEEDADIDVRALQKKLQEKQKSFAYTFEKICTI